MKLARASIAVTALLAPAVASAAPGVVKRIIVVQGRTAGSSIVRTAADGTMSITLDQVENGRGPHTDATLRLRPDGGTAAFHASGHHTFGARVDEDFTRDGDHARWKSTQETGERSVSGPAVFYPAADLFEANGLIVEAALAHGGHVALLPAGEAKIEKLADVTVKANGQSRHLTDYGLSGLYFQRSHVWVDDGGHYFGEASPFDSFLPAGWQSVAQQLVDQQQAIDRAHYAAVTQALTHRPPAAGLVYTHARLLDVEAGRWLPDQSLLVVGDRIAAIGPKVTVPAGAEVVDLHGKALIPGLWDMHAHLGDGDGMLDIASGVTTVRDVGNDPDHLDELKQRWESNTAVGPHVYRFGFIEGRNAKAASSKVTAETEAEAKAGVAFYAKRGYDGMKIYNSIRPELVPIIAKEAHARGMQVTGHIPVHMLAHEAVDAGYDGIEHINMLYLNFVATHDTDTRDTTRFTLVGDKAADFDLKGKPMRDFIAQLRQHHTVIDPTVDAFEDLLVDEPGQFTPGLEPTMARLPLLIQRSFRAGGLPLGDKKALYRRSFDKLLALVKLLADEHVTEVVGTDALAGLFLHHELALFVRAGLTPAQALRMATLEPARVMHQEAHSGSIAVGKNADLVVIDGDPLAHIDDVGKVVSTMRAGLVFPSAALYREMSIAPLLP